MQGKVRRTGRHARDTGSGFWEVKPQAPALRGRASSVRSPGSGSPLVARITPPLPDLASTSTTTTYLLRV